MRYFFGTYNAKGMWVMMHMSAIISSVAGQLTTCMHVCLLFSRVKEAE